MSQLGLFDDGGLDEFAGFAAEARAGIRPGAVDWTDSPLAWMRHNGPRTKSKLARDIARAWLRARNIPHREGEAEEHFVVGDERVAIHLAIQGKDGKLEFAKLREPGLGIDVMLWIGVEPHRARIWRVRPESVRNLPTYKAEDPRYHHYALDVDDPPAWATELAAWNGAR